MDVLEQIHKRQERNRQNDRAVRRLVKATAKQFDADLTADDPGRESDDNE